MDLDELQSVQSRERQTDSLQQLRATFYQDAAEYIHSLEAERDRAAEGADDPWNSPEVGRLNDDIDTAEQTVEAIYERRVGKIVKMASLAAADMPTEDEGLTEEERRLFETLVTAIEENRDSVFAILDGDTPVEGPGDFDETPDQTATPSDSETARADQAGPSPDHAKEDSQPPEETQRPPAETAEPAEQSDGSEEVGAADLMGSGTDEPATDGASDSDRTPPDSGATDDGDTAERSDGGIDAGTAESEPVPGPDSTPRPDTTSNSDSTQSPDPTPDSDGSADGPAESGSGSQPTADSTAVDRTTIRITENVGEIFGVDERAYELSENDVVTLPEPNAGPLLDSDAAERID